MYAARAKSNSGLLEVIQFNLELGISWVFGGLYAFTGWLCGIQTSDADAGQTPSNDQVCACICCMLFAPYYGSLELSRHIMTSLCNRALHCIKNLLCFAVALLDKYMMLQATSCANGTAIGNSTQVLDSKCLLSDLDHYPEGLILCSGLRC